MSIEFNVNAIMLLQFVLAIVLPLLVGLVTTRETNPGRKAVLLAVLALATSLVTEAFNAASNNETYDLGAGLFAALGTFVISVAMHYGLWKPTSVTAAAQNSLVKSGDPHN